MRSFAILLALVVHLNAISLGETLFNGNCTTCHEGTLVAKSAPTTEEINRVYKNEFKSKKEFVEFMATWVYDPDAKTALMPEAIRKYELMPILGLDKESLKIIAEYMYEME